jgi:uncharacterized phage protein (TIGR02216 family)
MTPFPWARAIGFGLGVLRLAPAQFWAMTPRELSLAFEAVFGVAGRAPARETLEALMAAFPDRESRHG